MKKRIVIVGPGLIGKVHARIVSNHAKSVLAGIVGPRSPRNVAVAEQFDAPFFENLHDALSSGRVDGVIVSSPNSFHFEHGMACIAAGVPVLIEKPITQSVEEARKLCVSTERTGAKVLVGHHRTYSTLLETAVGFLRSEEFGELVALQGAALFYKPDGYFVDGPWRTQLGGGPIMINLIHEIGLMRCFGGEIRRVSAIASNSHRKFEVEDSVSISLEFASGAVGTFLLSDCAASARSWEMTSGENPAYPSFPNYSCYHFAGTMGSLDFPSMETRSYLGRSTRSWWSDFNEGLLARERRDPLIAQFDHFLHVASGVAEPRVSALDGYRNMSVLQAVQQTIMSGKVTDVLA